MQQTNTTVIPFSLSDKSLASQAAWVAGFSLLTAVAAQIEIPHNPVPLTLQTFVVLLSGALLGKRNGMISQALYLLMGIAGLPVFAHLGFGIARVLGPAGGYLLSFPIAAFIVGLLAGRSSSFLWSVLSMAAGLFTVFSLGVLHLNVVYYHDWSASLANGFLIFSWWDAVKIIAAAGILRSASRR